MTSRNDRGRADAGGVEAEFEEFVAACSPRLLRTAFLLTGDRGHAEDLVQTALLRTVRRWKVARNSPEAFARRVLVNLAKNRWRGAGRRVAEAALEVEPAVAGHGDRVVERHALLRVIRRLPARQRAVLVLRFFDDLSVEQVAAVLGCSVGTVKSHTHRALATLRELLTDHKPLPDRENANVDR